jgi:RNA polymerase sigma factor (sigma-70 family)
MRRPATASRTYGRYAVALRAIPDSAAYPDAPTSRRRTAKRKISYNDRRVDRPRSFRDDQRAVIVLHQLEGLSYREVAAVVNTSEDAVRGRLHRARLNLLKSLRSWS